MDEKYLKLDKYDEAILYLTEHPEEIEHAWKRCSSHFAGVLFQFATNKYWEHEEDGPVGCLTMVCHQHYVSATPTLSAAIKADKRIPDSWDSIRIEHLPVFAEWQRRLDKELNRA